MNEPSVVHLIDDDDSFLRAMTRLLCAEGMTVRSFAAATSFLRWVSPLTRGCIVADLNMPDIGGLQLQAMLAQTGATMPVIFLTGQGDIPSTVRAMRSGAADFIEKSAAQSEIIAAIEAVLERDTAESVERMRLEGFSRRFARLTKREREVLQHVVRGEMNKQIAAMLEINERTVKLHRQAITTKLGVHSAARLATVVCEGRFFGDAATSIAKA
jgi:FixJ family two-component response regulator